MLLLRAAEMLNKALRRKKNGHRISRMFLKSGTRSNIHLLKTDTCGQEHWA
jgi:hypothetical protein